MDTMPLRTSPNTYYSQPYGSRTLLPRPSGGSYAPGIHERHGFRMAGIVFRGARKSKKVLKINFCGFKFYDSNQSRVMALHKR